MASETHLIEIEEILRLSGGEGVKREFLSILEGIAEGAERISRRMGGGAAGQAAGGEYATQEIAGLRRYGEAESARLRASGAISSKEQADLSRAYTSLFKSLEQLPARLHQFVQAAGFESQKAIRTSIRDPERAAAAAAGGAGGTVPPGLPPASAGKGGGAEEPRPGTRGVTEALTLARQRETDALNKEAEKSTAAADADTTRAAVTRRTAALQELYGTEFASEQAENVRAGYRLHAAVLTELASTDEYAGYKAEAAVAQARNNAMLQEMLAGDREYAEAQAIAARAKAQQNAMIQEELAKDGQYAEATGRAARARDIQARRLAEFELAPESIQANVGRQMAQARLRATQQWQGSEALLAEHRADPENSTIMLQAARKSAADEVNRQRELILEQNRSEQSILAQTAALAQAKERRVALERGLTAGVVAQEGESTASLRGRTAAVQQARAAEQRAVTAREILANERGELDAIVQQKALERRLNQEIESRVRQANIAQNSGQIGTGGTLFQRLQATLQARQSGDVVDPTRLMGLGQFFTSRALTTVGFAASGAVLYGGLRTLKEMVQEAEELDRVSNQIRAQFEALGRSDQFAGFRAAMLDIARQTGVAGQEVLAIGSRMAGAFQDPRIAIEQTQQAMEAMQATGMTGAEALNTFVAMTKTFGTSIREVSDEALSLQDHFGASAKEIVNSAAVIAPVAREVGLSQMQLMGLIAAAAQATGKSTSGVAEGFGRILPELQKSAGPMIELFRQVPALQRDFQEVTHDFATGNEGQALVLLFRHWKDLSGAQQSAFYDMLGGRKNAQDLAAALNQPDTLIKAMDGDYTKLGRTSQSFAAYQQSLMGILARLGEEFRQIGDALARSGALDGLKLLAGGVLGAVTVIGGLLKAADAVNSALGGWPGRIATIVIAFKALELAISAAAKAQEALAGITAAGRGLAVLGGGGPGGAIGGVPIPPIIPVGGGGAGAAAAVTEAAEAGPGLTAEAAAMLSAIALGTPGRPVVTGSAEAAAMLRDIARPAHEAEAAAMLSDLARPHAAEAAGMLSDVARPASAEAAAMLSAIAMGPGRRGPAAVTAAEAEAAAVRAAAFRASLQQTGAQLAEKDILPSLLPGQGVGRAALWTGALGARPAPLAGLFGRIGQIGMRNVPGLGGLGNLPGFGGLEGIGSATGIGGSGWLAEGSASLGLATAGIGAADVWAISQAQQARNRVKADRDAAQTINEQQFRGEDVRQLLDTRDIYRKPGGLAGVQESVGDFIGGKIGVGGLIRGRTAAETQHALETRRETVREFDAAVDAGLFSALPKETVDKLRSELDSSEGKKGAADAQKRLLALNRTEYAKVRKAAEESKRIEQTQNDAAEGNTTLQLETVQTIQEQLNAGRTSLPQAVSAIRQQISDLRKADPGGLNKNIQQQLGQALSTLQSVEQQAISEQIALAQMIAQGTGQQAGAPMLAAVVGAINKFGEGTPGTPGNMGVNAAGVPNAIAKPGTQSTTTNDLTPDQQLQLGQQGYQAGYQSWQDRISHAGSAAQALDIARAGATVDPAVRGQLEKAYEAKWHEKLNLPDYQASPEQLDQLSQQALNEQVSRIQLTTAQRGDILDPAVAAKMNQAIANANLASAEALADTDPTKITKVNQAKLQQIQANQAAANVPLEIAKAQAEYNKALAPEDSLAQAREAQNEADLAARGAHGRAAQLNAAAQRLAADRQMRDAMYDISQSRIRLLQAQASAAGDDVEAARLNAQMVQNDLDKAIAEHADEGKINDLKAQKVAADNQLRQSTLSEKEDLIQFNLDMERITIGQAIEQYTALMSIANPKEQRDLLRKIKQLRDQAGQDLQFNIPSEIKLPTLYEVRRFEQGGYTQDNRQVNVVMHINNGMDQAAAGRWLSDTVGRAPRVMSGSRRV